MSDEEKQIDFKKKAKYFNPQTKFQDTYSSTTIKAPSSFAQIGNSVDYSKYGDEFDKLYLNKKNEYLQKYKNYYTGK